MFELLAVAAVEFIVALLQLLLLCSQLLLLLNQRWKDHVEQALLVVKVRFIILEVLQGVKEAILQRTQQGSAPGVPLAASLKTAVCSQIRELPIHDGTLIWRRRQVLAKQQRVLLLNICFHLTNSLTARRDVVLHFMTCV